MANAKACSSCGRKTDDYSEFDCPKCGGTRIVRCKSCRENVNVYECRACGFQGP